MQGGYNTYNKVPWGPNEVLDLPQYHGTMREKLYQMKKGLEVGRGTPQIGLNPTPMNTKNQRKLVILPAKPPPRKTKSVMRTLPKEVEKVPT